MVPFIRLWIVVTCAGLIFAGAAWACVEVGDTTLRPEIHVSNLDSGATVIQGVVNNVCVDSVRVALWALTNHWYEQPFCPPASLIQPDNQGHWSSTTHGWYRMVALLVKYPGYTGADECQDWDHPSMDPGVLAWDGGVPAPTLAFCGYQWISKHGGPRSPNNDDNYFSDYNATVESDGLHLRTSGDGSHWYCAEVLLDHSLGYGTYSFRLLRRADQLDDHAVFAAFIYDSTNREIDFEFSRAIGIPQGNNAQYVVQPYTSAGNRHTYGLPAEAITSHRLVWWPSGIQFTSWIGSDSIPHSGDIIQDWTYTGADNPESRGRERMRFNLWLDGAQAQHADEMVIGSFRYSPYAPPAMATIAVVDHAVQLRWRGSEGQLYRINTDNQANGSFSTLVGTTYDTSYVIPNGDANAIRFYRVTAITP